MAETVQTADSSGQVKPQSPQEPPKPKAQSGKRSGTGAKRPKTNARGVPVTNWDVPENDPNLRKHAGEDPTGESNKLAPVPGEK